MQIPASSTEYLHIPVTGPDGVDLTGAQVRIAAVMHRDNPSGSEWKTADWIGGEARLLIGPGSELALARGDYRVWVSVDPPGAENITRIAGHLGVT
ncbi:hypothetical protein GCM10009837_07570 [Streptomyces durmitorensis]|uniref:Uncharacterized protein n=1 Tax=Streptomyces durmitorensis TaxID=319947 RepID=A0ABY4PKQ0_9ACTN|nr:hypothetical protein [Streptomyces durmitorensis]UQT54353.1 hypothetical protein M4V62_04220 [Streptomyces durmitorensis]